MKIHLEDITLVTFIAWKHKVVWYKRETGGDTPSLTNEKLNS